MKVLCYVKRKVQMHDKSGEMCVTIVFARALGQPGALPGGTYLLFLSCIQHLNLM